MTASLGSFLAAFCVTACAASSTFFGGTARAVEAALTDAPPGACGAALARVETALSQARASGHIVASAPESVDAMLHRQPTSQSIARAQTAAVEKIEDSITAARKLRAEGKRAECIGMLEKVALQLGVR
jgi:hypothetical protein